MERTGTKTTSIPEGGYARNPRLLAQGARLALSRLSWVGVALVLIVAGLLLRTTTGELPASLRQVLPWLDPPSVTIYFPDAEQHFLVPVTRRVSSEQASPEGAVRQLLRGPEDGVRLATLFDGKATLSSMVVEEGIAVIDLSLPRSGAPEPHPAIAALASTLQGFQGITSIQLRANGNLLGDSPVPPVVSGARNLYFMYGSYLVPVPVDARTPAEALRLYLQGPQEDSGLEGLPQDVRLLEYRFDADRGLVYANFTYTDSVRRLALDDPDGVRRALTGIIASLTAFPEVKAAMLDFQGHARLGLGQCADLLRSPQARPRVLNDESTVMKR